ncbi:hypothetical protein GPA27_11315 [Aromatoleum toluolicum]|uniref:Uncharacterized protein n=1 Tax=Aromatoleum toluolicum TaxID=90060 RepID=A0ABX1NFA7_9RHOO|nr:hypothetical protein [Aromatoleum toluolicum]NMF97977.1 hypothetical protein [Aromatoleum toluolicum]
MADRHYLRRFRNSIYIAILFLLSGFAPAIANDGGAHRDAWFAPCIERASSRFRTGFDGSVRVRDDVAGKRGTFEGWAGEQLCAQTAEVKGTSATKFGRAIIEFEGGSEDERGADIVQSPAEASNRVLRFWIAKPNVITAANRPVKGRVQMSVHGSKGVRELGVSVRMFLHSDFNIVRSFPGTFDWLTVSEWWNNASWTGEGFPFRITVNLIKDMPGSNGVIYFQAHAQTLNVDNNRWKSAIWSEINREFVVPVGKWVTLDYGFVEGDEEKGRFLLTATVEGEKKKIIFDVKGHTHHPDDPKPGGLSEFNPIKLYTSSRLIDFVRERGGTMQIMWDDLELAACPGCAARFVERAQ